ncbi:MAG: delta-60 repeat domain-containing protein, partial [Pirellulaceae bacterium]
MSFGGGDGIVTSNLGSADSWNAAVLQADGKLLVAGKSNANFALGRYNIDGSLDTAFGGGSGIVTTNLGGTDEATGIALRSDGRILLGGSSGSDFALVRYLANGSLDTAFGG